MILANFHQQPTTSAGTETGHTQQESVVARFTGKPEISFPPDRRTQCLALARRLQGECLSRRREDGGGRSVPEENRDAVPIQNLALRVANTAIKVNVVVRGGTA